MSINTITGQIEDIHRISGDRDAQVYGHLILSDREGEVRVNNLTVPNEIDRHIRKGCEVTLHYFTAAGKRKAVFAVQDADGATHEAVASLVSRLRKALVTRFLSTFVVTLVLAVALTAALSAAAGMEEATALLIVVGVMGGYHTYRFARPFGITEAELKAHLQQSGAELKKDKMREV